MLADAAPGDHVSVNDSFHLIDERQETIRQIVAYHRELEGIFGAALATAVRFVSRRISKLMIPTSPPRGFGEQPPGPTNHGGALGDS